jgi:integrase
MIPALRGEAPRGRIRGYGRLQRMQRLREAGATGAAESPDPGGRGGDAGVERTSVPKIGVRDLRHTRATFLLLYGVPVTLVSKRLGKAKVPTTRDMYSHTLPGFEHRAMESIGAALFG